jgi:hypothetical protein
VHSQLLRLARDIEICRKAPQTAVMLINVSGIPQNGGPWSLLLNGRALAFEAVQDRG